MIINSSWDMIHRACKYIFLFCTFIFFHQPTDNHLNVGASRLKFVQRERGLCPPSSQTSIKPFMQHQGPITVLINVIFYSPPKSNSLYFFHSQVLSAPPYHFMEFSVINNYWKKKQPNSMNIWWCLIWTVKKVNKCKPCYCSSCFPGEGSKNSTKKSKSA